MGWIKDIHDLIVLYTPKSISFDVEKVKSSGKNTIYYRNTSGRSVEVVDIHINGINVNEHYPVDGSKIDTQFIIPQNQQKTLEVYSHKDVEPPKSIQFYVKTKLKGVKKMEYSL